MSVLLVPLDATPAADAVLPAAARIARERRARVVLLSVGATAETAAQDNEQRAAAQRVFSAARPLFEGLDLRFRSEATNDAVSAIEHAAAEEHADAILLAQDARVGRSAVADPDVAERLRASGLPIEIVAAPSS